MCLCVCIYIYIGENTDTKLVDGAPVMQEGALGGGHAPGSSGIYIYKYIYIYVCI